MCLDHTTGFPNWRWLEDDKKAEDKVRSGQPLQLFGRGHVPAAVCN